MGAGFEPGDFVSLVVVGAGSGGSDMAVGGGRANDFGAFQIDVSIDLSENLYSLVASGDDGTVATAALFVGTK